MSANYPSPKAKANLKLVAPKKSEFVAPGPKPTDAMAPATYVIRSAGASIRSKGNKKYVVPLYEVAEGQYRRTSLKQWLEIRIIGRVIDDTCPYFKVCKFILGGEIADDANLDPAVMFNEKLFVAEVGYSYRDADGNFDPQNYLRKKYEKDFLRVHKLLEVL
jgi:hypothetical protein